MACFCGGLSTTCSLDALAADEPKQGGTLIYADSPPSLGGHREPTFATVDATALFYSVLIRIKSQEPDSSTGYVYDLFTKMPNPADDVAASWQEIIHPRPGDFSASYYVNQDLATVWLDN